MSNPLSDPREYTEWKSLPPLDGGVWVAMVTEVLDDNGIPNLVKTDLSAGGLGVVTGTTTLGKLWRVQVPAEYYEQALDIYDSLFGDHGVTEEGPEIS
ncbi:hypothetical protein HZB60_10045 [candidate division KSB1 bacterium]|nr:hypothetical protein [candidate division KSB1 bacterium]